jgi:hypothetical protein
MHEARKVLIQRSEICPDRSITALFKWRKLIPVITDYFHCPRRLSRQPPKCHYNILHYIFITDVHELHQGIDEAPLDQFINIIWTEVGDCV